MIKKFMANTYNTNSYLVTEGQEGVLIDPVADKSYIEELLSENDITLKGVIYTHGHFDHIASANEIYKQFGCNIYVHESESDMLVKPELNLSVFFGKRFVFEGIDRLILVSGNQDISIGNIKFKILHTPGHTPGCICIIYDDSVFTGDTLFKGSIGRTDFPGGDFDVMKKSLDKLKTLDSSLSFHPGHGESGTIGDEIASNPYME